MVQREKVAAEEERGHAHEQVLSLIRECNALEEQVCMQKYLCKEKCNAIIPVLFLLILR